MKVDFLKQGCQRIVNDLKFGICDDDNKLPAYIKISDEAEWIATVINNEAKEITFTAIDNCIDIYRANGELDKRCDVMLNYANNLLFVELKNKRKNWKSDGLAQIEATIKRMIKDNKDFYDNFNKRKAIVANSKQKFPCFETNDMEHRDYFKRKYKIRIQFESEIII
jgi:hypothetical protein